MKYENICKGNFIARPNRFIAEVEIGGELVRAHVKNTGRCRELLTPGAEVYLEDFAGRMGNRKLRYSLIGVKKGSLLINMDSQAPNQVCEEALLAGTLKLPGMKTLTEVQREKTFESSRFDFYIEDEGGRKGWLEVKGVTLEEGGCRQISRCAYGTGHKASAGACTGRRAGISGICAVCGADERNFLF